VAIKENLSVWTGAAWSHYRADFIEPIPRSSPTIVEMVTASGATVLAANGVIAKQVVAILQLSDGEILHLRWEPLDDVEGVLWEQPGQGRFQTASVAARVDLCTATRDPYLSTTTFFILGRDRDMNLEVRNPVGYATPAARFVFWGFRYIVSALNIPETERAAMSQGNLDTVKRVIGPTTWIPAEGRAA